ncbi:hypothetical protein J4Q44_G00182570 [Coregonus suidteri]|uniref:Uncharacterized protein n=1 Tax=Coregonus suidteri TaxID=861788 RepID=A0AAN8LKG2_9TELE
MIEEVEAGEVLVSDTHIKEPPVQLSSTQPRGALTRTATGQAAPLTGMAPIRDSVSHSPNQTGLDHPGLDSQYDNSPWSSGSPCDSNSNWGKVLVDSVCSDTPSPASAWPSSSSSSGSNSAAGSSSGSGSDPELTSECMDADSASSSGSEKNLAATMMVAATATSSVSSPSANGNGDGNRNRQQGGNRFSPLTVVNGSAPPGSDGGDDVITCNGAVKGPWGGVANGSTMNIGPNDDDAAAADGSHANKLSPWASANGMEVTPSTLNPKANRSAWPDPQGPPACKIGLQGGSLGWGGMQPGSLSPSLAEQRHDLLNGTTVKARHLNTEATNGPNNTTNAVDTSSLPNSTGGSVQMSEPGSGLRSWGAGGGGVGSAPGDQLSNGPLSGTQQPRSEGLAGGFSMPWGASGPGDTVNGQGRGQSSPAAAAAYNGNNNSKAPGGRWDSGPAASPLPHNLSSGAGVGSNGNGVGPDGIPRPRGGGAASSSSSSSSSSSGSSSNRQPSNGEWSSLPGNNSRHSGDGRKPGGGANGWKSLEDDALGMGGGARGGVQGPPRGCWGRSGGSEGSGESSGGPNSDGDRNDPRRRGPLPGSTQPVLSSSDVDPRVLCNTGWGQTPVRQNTAWDVTSPAPRPNDRKPSNGGPGWGSAGHKAPSQTSSSGGWGDGPGNNAGPESGGSGWAERKALSGCGDRDTTGGEGRWEDGSSFKNNSNSSSTWGDSQKEDRSNTWTNAPKPQKQGWGAPSGGGGGGGDRSRGGGGGSYWGQPQKTSGSGGWDNDSDRSGSGGWGEPGRPANTNTHPSSSSSTWGGSGGSSTPDQTHGNNPNNPHSGWGEPPKPQPQNHPTQGGWGEPAMKPSHPSQSWGDPAPKPCPSEWGKGPDSNPNPGPDPRGPPPGPGGSKPSGWMGGAAVPAGPSHKEEESTGWEEPSPESVRRRMEIDDGTAAWGDPSKYNCSGVNMWNKTSQSEQDAMAMTTPPQPQQQPPPPQNSVANKDKTCSPGWGDQFGGPQKMESGTWREPSGGWGGRGPQDHNKPGPKPMQQESSSWCGEEVSCQSSWEPEEEVEIGMWSNTPSHRDRERDGHRDGHGQDNRNNGPQQHSWNYMKKVPPKMNKSVNRPEDPWMNQFVKQFNNMNYPRDSPEDSLKSNKMEMGVGPAVRSAYGCERGRVQRSDGETLCLW